jgi:long-subunit fatty acid transport protein
MTSRQLLAMLVVPLGAGAAEPTISKSDGKVDQPLHASIALSTIVGEATFVANRDTNDAVVAQSVSLGPSYRLTDHVSVGLGWSLGWEYTTPDGPPGAPVNRRYSPSDISGSISHSDLWSDHRSGLRLSGSIRAIAPTSFESRQNHTITNVTVSPSLSRAFLKDRLTLSYGFGFTKYFPAQATRGFVGCADDPSFLHPPGQEQPSTDSQRCGGGGMNTNFSISNSLGGSYKFTDKLSGSIGIGLSRAWKFTPDGPVGSSGEPGLTGGLWQTTGDLSMSYAINDTYSVSGGVSSGQPALDSRQSRPRFPLFDFETPANGFTTFGVTLSGRI